MHSKQMYTRGALCRVLSLFFPALLVTCLLKLLNHLNVSVTLGLYLPAEMLPKKLSFFIFIYCPPTVAMGNYINKIKLKRINILDEGQNSLVSKTVLKLKKRLKIFAFAFSQLVTNQFHCKLNDVSK